MRWNDLHIDLETGTFRGAREGSLTPTEARVVRYLAGRMGTGATVEELEREVWKLVPGTRSKTVGVTLRRLRSALGIVQRRSDGAWTLVRPCEPELHVPHPVLPVEGVSRRIASAFEKGWTRVVLHGPPGMGKSLAAAEFVRQHGAAAWVEEVHPQEVLPTEGLVVLDAIEGFPGTLLPGVQVLATSRRALEGAWNLAIGPWGVEDARQLFQDANRIPGPLRVPSLLGAVAGGMDWRAATRAWLEETVLTDAGRRLAVLLAASEGPLLPANEEREAAEELVHAGWAVWNGTQLSLHPSVRAALRETDDVEAARGTLDRRIVLEVEVLHARLLAAPDGVAEAFGARAERYVRCLSSPSLSLDEAARLGRCLRWFKSWVHPLDLSEAVDALIERAPGDVRFRVLSCDARGLPLDLEQLDLSSLDPIWQAEALLVAHTPLVGLRALPLPALAGGWTGVPAGVARVVALLEVPVEGLEAELRSTLEGVRAWPVLGLLARTFAADRLARGGKTRRAIAVAESGLNDSRRYGLPVWQHITINLVALMVAPTAPRRAARLWSETVEASASVPLGRLRANALLNLVLLDILVGDPTDTERRMTALAAMELNWLDRWAEGLLGVLIHVAAGRLHVARHQRAALPNEASGEPFDTITGACDALLAGERLPAPRSGSSLVLHAMYAVQQRAMPGAKR